VSVHQYLGEMNWFQSRIWGS